MTATKWNWTDRRSEHGGRPSEGGSNARKLEKILSITHGFNFGLNQSLQSEKLIQITESLLKVIQGPERGASFCPSWFKYHLCKKSSFKTKFRAMVS